MLNLKLRRKIKCTVFLVLFAEFFSVLTGCAKNIGDFALQPPIIEASTDNSSATTVKNNFEINIKDPDMKIPEDAVEWIELFEKKNGVGSSESIIMSEDEIHLLNDRIRKACKNMFDMDKSANSYENADIKAMIEKYPIPSYGTVRKNGVQITHEERNSVLANRNLDGIAESVTPLCAIITARADLTSLPSDFGFYDRGDTFYNKIQETELSVGTPVLVLHKSANGEFVFIQSYFYRGWVRGEKLAYCTDQEYESFRNTDAFVTVTEARVDISGIQLDMGVKLPYVTEDHDNFYVNLPCRSGNGDLELRSAKISKTDAVFGDLPFTMKNYYTEAFRYLGYDYGWGGADGGVDCSGFVCAVFRTFGIYIPRNTRDQSVLDVNLTKLSGMGDANIHAVISSADSPTAIYRPGHVMLYLGTKDGMIHIIHAPSGGKKVTSEPLTYLTNITGITKFE